MPRSVWGVLRVFFGVTPLKDEFELAHVHLATWSRFVEWLTHCDAAVFPGINYATASSRQRKRGQPSVLGNDTTTKATMRQLHPRTVLRGYLSQSGVPKSQSSVDRLARKTGWMWILTTKRVCRMPVAGKNIFLSNFCEHKQRGSERHGVWHHASVQAPWLVWSEAQKPNTFLTSEFLNCMSLGFCSLNKDLKPSHRLRPLKSKLDDAVRMCQQLVRLSETKPGLLFTAILPRSASPPCSGGWWLRWWCVWENCRNEWNAGKRLRQCSFVIDLRQKNVLRSLVWLLKL